MSIQSIAVIGLGYVGLPLAVHLARAEFNVVGVDINPKLVETLLSGRRANMDLPKEVFPLPDNLQVVTEPPGGCEAYIVCVPTPHLDGENRMDPTYVVDACWNIGKVISDDGIVVIESTVTPGATEGMLREAIRATKGDYNFHICFSPERVNPGASYFYEMGNTEKLVGAEPQVARLLTEMYGRIFQSVVVVGVREAEIAKAFENTQRDMNIALMNELALQCHDKGLDYSDVVRGLRTKKTSPVFISGMVGGHCIPVDPYFLAEYYEDEGCLALHGRAINEDYIARIGDLAIDYNEWAGPVVIIGKSYKNGVIDTRNSGSEKLANYLTERGVKAILHEPLTDLPYTGPSPTLVVGAINHHPNLNVFSTYKCHSKCTLINIGGRFTEEQCRPFHRTVEL